MYIVELIIFSRIYRNKRSMRASLTANPSPGCQCDGLTGTSSYSSNGSSSSSGSSSRNIRTRLCSTEHAIIIDVEHNNFVLSPLDRQGNRRFHTPYVLSTIYLVLA